MRKKRKKRKRKTVITPEPVSLSTASSSLRYSRFVVPGLFLLTTFVAQILASPVAGAERGKKKADEPYALIFGTVWGPDNRPLFGVKVKIRRANEKKPRWVVYSDHNGEFAQRVPAGQAEYMVRADLKGYKPNDGKQLQPGDEVHVHIEYDERADIGLHLK